jgi:uncharacterized membrane protein YesL
MKNNRMNIIEPLWTIFKNNFDDNQITAENFSIIQNILISNCLIILQNNISPIQDTINLKVFQNNSLQQYKDNL